MKNIKEIKEVDINLLKPSEYNPRKASDREYQEVKKSLRKFGLRQPIIVNSAENRFNIVIGGHLRLKVAKELGYSEIPVAYVEIENIRDEQELNLRLNNNAGQNDMDLLAQMDIDLLEDVGFNRKELLKKFEVPEVIEPEIEFSQELGEEHNYIVLKFDNTVVSYIGSPFSVFLKGNECIYDERLPLKEDYDMTLQQLNKYRYVLRVNKFFYQVRQSEQEGGCAVYRNYDEEEKQLRMLQRKWGIDIVKEDKNLRSHNIKREKKRIDYNPIIKVPISGV